MKISMFQKVSLLGLAIFSLALLDGCVRLPPPDVSNPIMKVAVLPIHNYTADMDGPVWVRTGISQMVPTRYYTVSSNDEVDQILRDKMGVTLGGQLDYTNPATGAPSPSLVGQTLGVDGVIYCNLEEFQNLITGFYNRRQIKVKCSLVSTKTNDVVWQKEEEESHSEINLSVAGAISAVKQHVVGALINSALRSNPLQNETAAVINKLQNTIPSGPVVAVAQN